MSEVEQPEIAEHPDEYLRRSLRAMSGLLHFISFILLGGSIGFLPLLVIKFGQGLWPYLAFVGVLGVAALFWILARGLQDFRPWARIATLVISCIGVFAFPLGTVLFSPFFYVLIKGKHLFAKPVECANPSAPETERLAA